MPSLNAHYYLYLPTISFGKQNYDNEDTKYSMILMSTVKYTNKWNVPQVIIKKVNDALH